MTEKNTPQIHCVIGNIPHKIFKILAKYISKFMESHSKKAIHISSCLTNKKTSSFYYELSHSNERKKLQLKVTEFFLNEIEKQKKTFATDAKIQAKNMGDVLDEFLMNAIWDANPSRHNTDRTIPIKLNSKDKVQVQALTHKGNLILSVTDKFGLFKQDAAEKLMRHTLGSNEITNINQETKEGGAGLGLFMALQKLDCLIFEVKKGVYTNVTAIICKDHLPRELKKKQRTIILLMN